MSIKYLLLDAANTIIHKPLLWESLKKVLDNHSLSVDLLELKKNHKLISEIIHFPDRTDRTFYDNFNSKLLLSLGIIPTEELLTEIFSACTYLPWEAFEDTKYLKNISIPIGILSNFKGSLPVLLQEKFDLQFDKIIVSESVGMGKPSLEFYKHALQTIGLPANEILYIGDSLLLDIMPAQKLGLGTLLIDRWGVYSNYQNKISNFEQVVPFLK